MWLTRIISVLAAFLFVAALNPQTLPRSIHLRAKDGVDISGLVYEAKQPKAVVLLFHQAAPCTISTKYIFFSNPSTFAPKIYAAVDQILQK